MIRPDPTDSRLTGQPLTLWGVTFISRASIRHRERKTMNASERIRINFVKAFSNAVRAYGGQGKDYKLRRCISVQGGVYSLVDKNDHVIVHNLNGSNMESFCRILNDAAQMGVTEFTPKVSKAGLTEAVRLS